MAMSQVEIYMLAKSHGLSKEKAKVAAAIAMAESGGDPNAHNAKPPDDSYGLWQINMIGKLGPQRRAMYHLKADSDLYNPDVNAGAMFSLSAHGTNWGPWSTFTSGSYRSFLSTDVSEGDKEGWADTLKGFIGKNGGNKIAGAADVVASPFAGFGDLVSAVDKTAGWVSNKQNWVRVVFVVGGGGLILAGIARIFADSPAGKATLAVAGSAAGIAGGVASGGGTIAARAGTRVAGAAAGRAAAQNRWFAGQEGA